MRVTDQAMTQEHECRCSTLPVEWERCGKTTKATWSPGCDSRMLESALRHLGLKDRAAFIDWAASQMPQD